MLSLALELKTERVVVAPDKITIKKLKELATGLQEVRKSHSVFAKFPLLENESIEDWEKRCQPLAEAEEKRKDDEKMDDWLKRRYFKVDLDRLDMLVDTLKLIGNTFEGQGYKVSDEQLETVAYPDLKRFVNDVLGLCDLD